MSQGEVRRCPIIKITFSGRACIGDFTTRASSCVRGCKDKKFLIRGSGVRGLLELERELAMLSRRERKNVGSGIVTLSRDNQDLNEEICVHFKALCVEKRPISVIKTSKIL